MGFLEKVKNWRDEHTALSPDRAAEHAREKGASEEEVAAARADAERRQKIIRAGGAAQGS